MGLHFSIQRLVGAAPEFSGAPVLRSNSGQSAVNFAAAFPTLRSTYLYSLHLSIIVFSNILKQNPEGLDYVSTLRMFPCATKMDVIRQLVEAVSRTTPRQRVSAKTFQQAVEDELRAKGWEVFREFCVKDRGDGFRGRIDLVVTSPVRIAIELDRARVRKKSLFKLAQFDGLRFVILRQGSRVLECALQQGAPDGSNTKARRDPG